MIDPNAFPIAPEDCTLSTCSLAQAQVNYVPSLAGNAFFIAVFGIFLLLHLGLGIRYRTWGVLVAMCGGSALEVIGYMGRVMMHYNPFRYGPFDM
jgi:hypothetical protein